MRIAIITSPHVGSPKVLSSCLHSFLKENGVQSDLFHKIDVFKRLLKYGDVKKKHNIVLWTLYKLYYLWSDKGFIHKLKNYDAVVIVETSPHGYLRESYNFQKLKEALGTIPLLYHGVYYLGNAPTMVKYLKENNHHSEDTFDWHLAVSEVTEIRQKPTAPWCQIGLHLKSTGLKPLAKERFFALVDFPRQGFEEIRNVQIKTLEQLNIDYIALEGKYAIEEIRELYKKATVYFMQSGESFGVPIAECLSCGCYILTPDSSWPMAWRLDENPQIHGPGKLADCFILYNGGADLDEKLVFLKNTYDLHQTPKKVFDSFYSNYPNHYEGNKEALHEILQKIQNKQIG